MHPPFPGRRVLDLFRSPAPVLESLHLPEQSFTMSSIDDLCIAGALSIQNGGFRRDVFLQEVTEYLILNKQHLPESVISSLAEAFGKQNAKNINVKPRERAGAARMRLQQYTKDDILQSAKCLTLNYNPATFWNLQGMFQHAGDYSNVVQCLYHGSRSIGQQAVTFRAFFTTAIHLFTKRVCERLETRCVTEGVIAHCVRLILGPHPNQHEAGIVEANIRSDNSAGAIYKQYASGLEGYGAYFLIHIIPLSVIEITFNQKDDIPFAIQQLKDMGLPEVAKELGLHDQGNTLMSYIENQFPACDVKPVTRRKKGIGSTKQPTKITKNKKRHRNVNISNPNNTIPLDHDSQSSSHISPLATNDQDNHGSTALLIPAQIPPFPHGLGSHTSQASQNQQGNISQSMPSDVYSALPQPSTSKSNDRYNQNPGLNQPVRQEPAPNTQRRPCEGTSECLRISSTFGDSQDASANFPYSNNGLSTTGNAANLSGVPPHPKRPCHRRQIHVAATEPFDNQEINVVTSELANSSSSLAQETLDPSASHSSHAATSNAVLNIESTHDNSIPGDYLVTTDEISLPASRPGVPRQYQPLNETLMNQPQLRISVLQRSITGDDNCIGPTPDSAPCDGDGAPMNQNNSFTGIPYEEVHNTAQVGRQVSSDESRPLDDCEHQGDATRSHKQIALQPEDYDRHSDLSPAPQVDSRELLDDLTVGGLYQVQQVNSSELLDDIRHASAIDIDDILREADNFTKSCEKRSYQFAMPTTLVS